MLRGVYTERSECAQHDRAAPVLSRLRAAKGLARRAGSPDGQSSSPNPGSFAAEVGAYWAIVRSGLSSSCIVGAGLAPALYVYISGTSTFPVRLCL